MITAYISFGRLNYCVASISVHNLLLWLWISDSSHKSPLPGPVCSLVSQHALHVLSSSPQWLWDVEIPLR